jgi:hypothetical protein
MHYFIVLQHICPNNLLDFLAEVTQHIPNKREHQIRYYGFYSNKNRGLQKKRYSELAEEKKPRVEQIPAMPETDTPFRKKCRITWAALIKAVYEACTEPGRSVDPLKCPKPVVSNHVAER